MDATTKTLPNAPLPKPWYQSKTLLVNGSALLVFLISALIDAINGGGLPPEFAQYSAYILVGLNILLRVVTKEPLDLSVFTKKNETENEDGDDDPPSTIPFLTLPFAAFVLISAFHAHAFAANPRAMIVGPTAAVPGDKILLDAGPSTDAETFRWEVRNRKSDDRTGFTVDPSGKILEIFSYPGVYDITLAVANGDGIDLARWTVTVYSAIPPGPEPPRPAPEPDPQPLPPDPTPPGPGPEPDPNPKPPTPPAPEPEPTFPDGEFNLARPAYKQAGLIVSPNRAVQAKRIAAGFDGVAAAISAGTLRGVEAIIEQLREANRQALGDELNQWAVFDAWFAGELEKLFRAGKLSSNESWATLLSEVATGLKAVK